MKKCREKLLESTTTTTTTSTTTTTEEIPTTTINLRESSSINFYEECENLTSISLRSCTLNNEPINDCSSIESTSCENLVRNVKYTLKYSNSEGILEAFLDLDLFNYVDDEQIDPDSLLQSFQVSFQEAQIENVCVCVNQLIFSSSFIFKIVSKFFFLSQTQ